MIFPGKKTGAGGTRCGIRFSRTGRKKGKVQRVDGLCCGQCGFVLPEAGGAVAGGSGSVGSPVVSSRFIKIEAGGFQKGYGSR